MRFYSTTLALCVFALTFFGTTSRDTSPPSVRTEVIRKANGRHTEPIWTLLDDCKLTASADGLVYDDHPESDPLMSDQGYLRLDAPPGSWGHIFCDASLIPPDPNDLEAQGKYDQLMGLFSDLGLRDARDLFDISDGEIEAGQEFYGPPEHLQTVVSLPFLVTNQAYEDQDPSSPYNTIENSIRRFFQPVVADSSGAPYLLPWDADFAGWSSSSVDAPDVGGMMQTEWIRIGAGKTDKRLLDFRVLWEYAVTKELGTASANTFFTQGPVGSALTWADLARQFGMILRCQAAFLRVANPSPINSNPLTIGGLTGVATGAQVSIGLSSFLQINIQAANGTDELDRGIDIHVPGFTCHAGEETKIYAYGVTATTSTLRFRKADATEFNVNCQRAGVGKIKFVIPEEHTGQMVIIRSHNGFGTRVYPYAATDIITVLP